MSYGYCDKCNHFGRLEVHKCYAWKAHSEEDHDEAVGPDGLPLEFEEFYATDAEAAAGKWSEQSNVDGDYYMMDGRIVEVTIWRAGVDPRVFTVCAEPSVDYHIREKSGGEA